MQDTALMLHTLLELGESMLADGADVRRVEQTLTRMGLAYGAVRMDVFVITSSIVLTMCFPDETSVTQTRRIEKSAVTDFGKLEAINAISRSYCEKPFPVQELADRLHLAKGCSPARWKLFAGSSLGAGTLTSPGRRLPRSRIPSSPGKTCAARDTPERTATAVNNHFTDARTPIISRTPLTSVFPPATTPRPAFPISMEYRQTVHPP